MTVLVILLIVSIIGNILLFLGVRNLLVKLEELEDYVESVNRVIEDYQQWILTFRDDLEKSFDIFDEADRLGAFEASDEVGEGFKILKATITNLKDKFIEDDGEEETGQEETA